jgi:hypothetical protein
MSPDEKTAEYNKGFSDATLPINREIFRLRCALIEIRDHWANQYDHPRKEGNRMYDGPYGVGVTDGHRAASAIARAALEDTSS